MDYITSTTGSSFVIVLTINFEKSRKRLPDADDILRNALIIAFVTLSNILDRQISAINNSNPKQTAKKERDKNGCQL